MKKQRILLAGLLLTGVAVLGGCGYKVDIRYNVDFYVDGEVYKSVGTDGKSIEMPQNPSKDGYQFDGWYTEEDGEGELVTFQTLLDQPLSEDIRLNIYAHFLEEITVEYVTGTDEVMEAGMYVEGDTMSALKPEITPENMVFGGWYTDEEFTTKWQDETTLTADITLYANWLSAQVTLTYDYNIDGIEDKTVQTKRFEKAESFVPEPIPDYEFVGWYLDEQGTQVFDHGQNTVDKDLTLYAKWNSEFVKVTFDYQHENFENKTVQVRRGEKVDEISIETLPLYHDFLGWFTRSAYGDEWNFDNAITQDTTLYAHWNDHTGNFSVVTFVRGEDNSYKEYTNVGDKLEEPYVHIPQGQTLVGWFRDAEFTQPWDMENDRVDSEEMTLYAKFDYIYITVTIITDDFTTTQTAKYGDTIYLPHVSKTDYYLKGWRGILENGNVTLEYSDSFTLSNIDHLANMTFTPMFQSIFDFKKISAENAYELTAIHCFYENTQETISIPSEHEGLPVTKIAAEACRNQNGFTKLIIPDSITHIGDYAFTACYELKEVTIGSNVTELTDSVFSDCRALEKVTFTGNRLTQISANVFFNTSIKSLTLPNSVETFGGIHCETLTEIDLGQIKELTGSFSGTKLAKLTLPATLETITQDISADFNAIIYVEAESKPAGWRDNWNASNLPVVWNSTVAKTVEKDGTLYVITNNNARLLRCNSSAENITVPETITYNGAQYPVAEIGGHAFYKLSNLKNLSLPNSLEKVEQPQFIGCNALVYHEENGVKYLGNSKNPYVLLKDLSNKQDVLTVPAETRIILGHSPNYAYTTYSIDGLVFAPNSNLKHIGPTFFSWSNKADKNIHLPAGVKYISEDAFNGKTTNIFTPETSKPEGWADPYPANVYYGVTQENLYKTESAIYILKEGEATLVNLYGDSTDVYALPSVLTVNGENYTLTKIGTYALLHVKNAIQRLFVPETVKYFEANYDTTHVNFDCIFVGADELPETWSEKWQPFGVFSNGIFLGVTQEDYIITEKAHYIAYDDYATAYLYVGEAVNGGGSTFLLPKTVNANGKELTVSHLHRYFISSVEYVSVILQDTVTHIPAGKTYGYGTQFFTTLPSQPQDWENGWNATYSGTIPVTYGLTGFTPTEKTYTFVTEGTAVAPITAYFLAKSPTTTVSNGKYFWGWYEDAAFSGAPIEFPYMGEGKTLYARFETKMIQDGKSHATAYDLTVGSYQSVNIDKAGETVYFKYKPTANKTCLFKSRGDYDTYGIIYQPTSIGLSGYKVVAEADGGGSGENFSVSYAMSSNFTYYFALRLVDSTQTGSFEFIVTLA